MGIIITVDGPSGAGKGTLCYALAEKLGFTLLDSGAIYRVTALAALKRHADLTDEEGLAELARHLDIQFIPKNGEVNVLLGGMDVSHLIRTQEVVLGGMDVSHLIRTQEVAEAASKVAVFPKVRSALLQLQQDFGKNDGLIADGRDMGTVVFPNAQVKLFLDASAEERAKRRYKQLQNKGINGNFAQILAEIQERDFRDRNREVAPLKPADDALLLDSTTLSIDEVIAQALAYIQQKASISI